MTVVALSVLVLALPAQAPPQADSGTMTIRLRAKASSFKVLVDRPPTGTENRGDVQWLKATLRNAIAQFGRPKGAIVGSDTETYTFVTPTEADVKVRATLPGAQSGRQAVYRPLA